MSRNCHLEIKALAHQTICQVYRVVIPRSEVRRPSSAAAWADFGAIYTLTDGNHHDPILGGRSVLTSLGYGPDGRQAEAYQKVENGGSCLRRVRSIASVMDTR
jgi:hypothetical protein